MNNNIKNSIPNNKLFFKKNLCDSKKGMKRITQLNHFNRLLLEKNKLKSDLINQLIKRTDEFDACS
jgi:hypothetical protein